MAVFCKVCGGNKTLHSPDLWKVHRQMFEQYDRLQREYLRYKKRASKAMLARTSK